MRIVINDKEVVIPSSLSEITLGQRIAFHNEHGRELDQMLDSIQKMKEDDPMRDLELMEFSFEKMFRTFAFFAGTTVEAVKEEKFINDVASIYHACLEQLFNDEQEIELQESFFWNDEEWILHTPELKNGSKMKFGEFIDAKQLIKDMVDLGAGKWESMLPICAIYLRRRDEEYKEEFLYEGSERLKLMESLPMNIAVQVGFFLTSTMNFLINTSTSFDNRESNQPENSPKNTLTATDG